jgi:hypothetical protein
MACEIMNDGIMNDGSVAAAVVVVVETTHEIMR